MRLYFSGALNLDLIYEVSSKGSIDVISSIIKRKLRFGREYAVEQDYIQSILCYLNDNEILRYKGGGGSSANTCVILKQQGYDTAFIGSCGQDKEGDIVLSSIKGTDHSYIKRAGLTPLCIILILKDNRDRIILVFPRGGSKTSSMGQSPYPSLEPDFSIHDFLHISSLTDIKGVSFHSGLIRRLKKGAILSFDPGEIYASFGYDAIRHIIERTNILFLTEDEMFLLFKGANDPSPLTILSLMNNEPNVKCPYHNSILYNTPILIIKRGKEGASCFWIERREQGRDTQGLHEAYERALRLNKDEIIDTTGAGDSFDAGFIMEFLRGSPPPQCLRAGVSLASICLKHWGARP